MSTRHPDMFLPPGDARALGELLDVVHEQFDNIENRQPSHDRLELGSSGSAWNSADWIMAAPALPPRVQMYMPFGVGEPVAVQAFHRTGGRRSSEITITFNEDSDETHALLVHKFEPKTGKLLEGEGRIENDRFSGTLFAEDTVGVLDVLFQHTTPYTDHRHLLSPTDAMRRALQSMDFGKSTEHASKSASRELLREAAITGPATFAIKALVHNRRHPGGEPSDTALTLERVFKLFPKNYTTTNVQTQTLTLTRDQFGEITAASQRFNIALGDAETSSGRHLSSRALGITNVDYLPYLPQDAVPTAADAQLFMDLITRPLTKDDLIAKPIL